MMIVGRQFLLGRKLMNDWNVSIHYQDGRETWQAVEQTVSALNRHEAVEYNKGFYAGMFRSKKGEWDTGKQPSTLVNPKRGDSKRYQWAEVPQGKIKPPLEKPRVQSVQCLKGSVSDNAPPPQKGKPSFSEIPADAP